MARWYSGLPPPSTASPCVRPLRATCTLLTVLVNLNISKNIYSATLRRERCSQMPLVAVQRYILQTRTITSRQAYRSSKKKKMPKSSTFFTGHMSMGEINKLCQNGMGSTTKIDSPTVNTQFKLSQATTSSLQTY